MSDETNKPKPITPDEMANIVQKFINFAAGCDDECVAEKPVGNQLIMNTPATGQRWRITAELETELPDTKGEAIIVHEEGQ